MGGEKKMEEKVRKVLEGNGGRLKADGNTIIFNAEISVDKAVSVAKEMGVGIGGIGMSKGEVEISLR